jgi:hypothetical protein
MLDTTVNQKAAIMPFSRGGGRLRACQVNQDRCAVFCPRFIERLTRSLRRRCIGHLCRQQIFLQVGGYKKHRVLRTLVEVGMREYVAEFK